MNPGLTLDGSTTYTRASQWVASNVRILSSSKVNEARFGYNSLYNNIAQQLAGVEDVDAEIGVPFKVADTNSWGVPSIQLSQNLSSFGNNTIPTGSINSTARGLLPFFPAANQPGFSNNFIGNMPYANDWQKFDGRIDGHVGDHSSISLPWCTSSITTL